MPRAAASQARLRPRLRLREKETRIGLNKRHSDKVYPSMKMKTNSLILRGAAILLFVFGTVSCMTTYDTAGRPVQSVDPAVAVAGAAAAGLVGYSMANNRSNRHYYHRGGGGYYHGPPRGHYRGY